MLCDLGQAVDLSESQFPPLQSGDSINNLFVRTLGGLNGILGRNALPRVLAYNRRFLLLPWPLLAAALVLPFSARPAALLTASPSRVLLPQHPLLPKYRCQMISSSEPQ